MKSLKQKRYLIMMYFYEILYLLFCWKVKVKFNHLEETLFFLVDIRDRNQTIKKSRRLNVNWITNLTNLAFLNIKQ